MEALSARDRERVKDRERKRVAAARRMNEEELRHLEGQIRERLAVVDRVREERRLQEELERTRRREQLYAMRARMGKEELVEEAERFMEAAEAREE